MEKMSQPNILIIMCDQLNAGVLGCYGGPVSTSNIDRLAREGVRFTSAVCPTPLCSPSRASMITGMYPHTHGISYNVNRRDYPAIGAPETEEGIRNNDITTEKLLSAAGYKTHHYGKWHLMDEDPAYYPDMFLEHHGYAGAMQERFAEVRKAPRNTWMNWYNWALPVTQSKRYQQAVRALGELWKEERHTEFVEKIGRLDFPLEQTFDCMTAQKTLAAIRHNNSAPFMITCSFNYPHDPNVVPSPYYDMFDPNEIELPGNFEAIEQHYRPQWSRKIVADLGEPGVREFMRVYYASVKLIDDQVGRILEALDRKKLADNTIVLFTADHGDMCGGHGMVWKSTDAFYEEVVRVPLIVRYPSEVRQQTMDMPCNIVDIMPTLLDFAGQPTPDHVEGVNLAPYLRGERSSEQALSYTYSERLSSNPEHTREVPDFSRGSYMIRGCEWKYCRYANGEEMLFDLKNDPGETRNLASDAHHKQTKKMLSGRLDEWLRAAENRRT